MPMMNSPITGLVGIASGMATLASAALAFLAAFGWAEQCPDGMDCDDARAAFGVAAAVAVLGGCVTGYCVFRFWRQE